MIHPPTRTEPTQTLVPYTTLFRSAFANSGKRRASDMIERKTPINAGEVKTSRSRRPNSSRISSSFFPEKSSSGRAAMAASALSDTRAVNRPSLLQIGRGHVGTPVTNENLVRRLLLEQTNKK